MAYSYEIGVMDGSSATVLVPFPFLEREHVTVSLDGAVVPTTDYTWVSDGEITLDAIPSAGTRREVRRTTPVDELAVSYQAGNLSSRNLNISFLQQLYLAQEAADAAGLVFEEQIGRAIRVPMADDKIDPLPVAADRASKFMRWSADGTEVQLADTATITIPGAEFNSKVAAELAAPHVDQHWLRIAGLNTPGDCGQPLL